MIFGTVYLENCHKVRENEEDNLKKNHFDHPKAYFWFAAIDFLDHSQVFSDVDGAACSGLERVSIRRPAHQNLVPFVAIDKVLTHSLDSRSPCQCPAGLSFFFLGPLNYFDCQWGHFVHIVLHYLS